MWLASFLWVKHIGLLLYLSHVCQTHIPVLNTLTDHQESALNVVCQTHFNLMVIMLYNAIEIWKKIIWTIWKTTFFFLGGGGLWVSRKGSMGWGEWRPGEFWVRKPGNLEWQRGTRSMDKIVKNLEKDEGFFRNGSENRVNHPKDSRNHIYIYTSFIWLYIYMQKWGLGISCF